MNIRARWSSSIDAADDDRQGDPANLPGTGATREAGRRLERFRVRLKRFCFLDGGEKSQEGDEVPMWCIGQVA